MKTKLIIFDLDGTLLYTLEDLMLSVNFALKKYGLEPRSLNEIRHFVGNGIYKLIERATDYNEDKINDCFETFKEHYKISYNNTYPYEGIIETLKTIKEMGIFRAVLSNKSDSMVKNLVDIYFKDLIDFSMGQKEGFAIKPDKNSTLFIMNKFSAKKDETVFIGDSEVDIQTAANAGIKCLSASWGFKGKDFLIKSGAKTILNSPEEILNYL